MSFDIRFPNITAPTEAGQLKQVASFLHQLVEQLNWVLSDVDKKVTNTAKTAESYAHRTASETEAQNTFNSIKALIIKSADIVNAYYESMDVKLEGTYVAQSDFGTYQEITGQKIEATSTEISSIYNNIQEIISSVDSIKSNTLDVSAHILSGLLYYDDAGAPVYGVEIGQRNIDAVTGTETFNKYARFTSDRLSFYDNNDEEVAYVSDKKLHITQVELNDSLRIGGFEDSVLPDGGVVTKWVGIGG